LVPGCKAIPLAVQFSPVRLALPLPPRLFVQLTEVTCVLSVAVPAMVKEPIVVK
jgi:hypothetical protein